MAAAGNRTTEEGMAQSFSLANIVPQAPMNNRKAWAGIERATRKYVMRAAGDVFVITGSVIGDEVQTIGSGVAVPRYLFKLVIDATTGRSWAHWLENVDTAKVGKPIALGELEGLVGFRF